MGPPDAKEIEEGEDFIPILSLQESAASLKWVDPYLHGLRFFE
jgi:hypothetical protein